jgi:hypothetical protein
VVLLGSAVAAGWSVISLTQQAGKVYKIAIFTSGTSSGTGTLALAAFVEELRQLGWNEGKNIVLLHRTRITDLIDCPGSRQNWSILMST